MAARIPAAQTESIAGFAGAIGNSSNGAAQLPEAKPKRQFPYNLVTLPMLVDTILKVKESVF
ncbi:hypothetical protein HZA56_06320 [Candidatus Poribacteria bacterium]|nr:hypothetical protein [Candidatus Poribacteria bacterium]